MAVTNILCKKKDDLHSVKLFFVPALNAVKFLGWLQKFGLAQNILGPVEGHGIRSQNYKQKCETFLTKHLKP